MTLQECIEDIKLEVTGGLTHLEIKDDVLKKYVERALKEVNRYIDTTKLITVPFSPCIDLGPYTDKDGNYHEGFKHNAVVNVFRTQGYTGDITQGGLMYADPMQAQMWMAFSNGNTMYNLQDYVMNFLSYNTLLQMRNTISTDMMFREDKSENKLYINANRDDPVNVTIEYIPIYEKVEDLDDPYWQDVVRKMATALVKIGLGRIRTKYTQSNALWGLDGEKLLEEGTTDLKELREQLRVNDQLSYPVD